jgi:hypothetical protein
LPRFRTLQAYASWCSCVMGMIEKPSPFMKDENSTPSLRRDEGAHLSVGSYHAVELFKLHRHWPACANTNRATPVATLPASCNSCVRYTAPSPATMHTSKAPPAAAHRREQARAASQPHTPACLTPLTVPVCTCRWHPGHTHPPASCWGCPPR